MQFLTVLAGANFRPAEAKQVLKDLARAPRSEWSKLHLHLERDPANQWDANAIKVIATVETEGGAADQGDVHREEHFLGFVAKADNRELAAILDAGDEAVELGLIKSGHEPMVERCEILDFASGEIKPTIVIEVSTGWEVGTLVHGDEDGDGEEHFLPEGDD
jgi:hypothetical protein